MRTHVAPCALLLPVATLLVAARPAPGFGRPEWAKPYLSSPTPAGPYIARSDTWAVVYGDVEVALHGEKAIESRHRLVLENLAPNPETYTAEIDYDEGQEDLSGLELNVERTFWHRISLSKQATSATVNGEARAIFVSAEKIEPHHRVVLEYTLADKLGFNPWRVLRIPRAEPIAQMKYSVDPTAEARGLRLTMVLPTGDALPAGFAHPAENTWTVASVPALARLRTKDLVYQPAADQLFPYALAYVDDGAGDSTSAYVQRYLQAWKERRKSLDVAQIAQLVKSLVGAAGSRLETARRLARFVQHDIQDDSSNERSLEAWLPLATQEILRSRKADCKGKVMLLQALLDAAGIESTPVLLRTSPGYFEWRQNIATTFVNHAVLAVNLGGDGSATGASLQEGPVRGWALVDPTLESVDFGGPLPGYEGLPALAVRDGPDPAFAIHTASPSAAIDRIAVRCTVGASGSVQTAIDIEDNGASELLRALAGTFDVKDARGQVLAALGEQGGQLGLTDMTLRRSDESASGFTELHLDLEAQHGWQEMSSSVLLESPVSIAARLAGWPRGFEPAPSPRPDDVVELQPPWSARRNTSGTLRVLEVTVDLSLPRALTWTPPPARRERLPWVSYDMLWSPRGDGSYRAVLRLEVPRGEWSATDRKTRLQLMDELLTGLYTPLLLAKTDPK
jgi:transglutaminase-like putative cysteine protease